MLDENQEVFSHFGARIPILNDLSPAATLITAGYNLTNDSESFIGYAKALLAKFHREYGWMYETHDPRGGATFPIDFTVWSELFSCPHCSGELVYWDLAYDEDSGKIADLLKCPHCSAELAKRDLVRRTTTYFDKALQKTRNTSRSQTR